MSVITNHERPGVYSAYEASSITTAKSGGGAVALVAAVDGANGKTVYPWYSYAQAVEDCGEGAAIAELARLALKNGAGVVYGIPVSTDYIAGFETMAGLEQVNVVFCDSTETNVVAAFKSAIDSCVEERRERLGVVCGAAGETVTQLVSRADTINSERIVLVAPGCVESDGETVNCAMCGAAVAGLIAGQSDPAVPLGGAVVEGITGLSDDYIDSEVDRLVRGGVTALECRGGQVSVIRGITTRTTTNDVLDATWRELTTIMVVDEVIPGIRNALKAKFARAKNTAQTRGAILSQVIVELENRIAREIIDSYEDVTVTALEDDPTVCLVEFAFAVTHGLNQIWLSAHITV